MKVKQGEAVYAKIEEMRQNQTASLSNLKLNRDSEN